MSRNVQKLFVYFIMFHTPRYIHCFLKADAVKFKFALSKRGSTVIDPGSREGSGPTNTSCDKQEVRLDGKKLQTPGQVRTKKYKKTRVKTAAFRNRKQEMAFKLKKTKNKFDWF